MVSVISQASTQISKNSAIGFDTSSDMSLDFGAILATGNYSDFRIKCDKFVFNVHKSILCSASSFFKAAIEGNTTESEENVISMNKDEAAIIARLLIYIYTGKYHIKPLSTWKHDRTTPFSTINDPYRTASMQWQASSKLAISMYQIADMTFIEPLKWTSRNNLLTSLRPDRTPNPNNQDQNQSQALTFWTSDEMDDIRSIVKAAYTATRPDDWMLHDPIVHRLLIGMQEHGCIKWASYQSLMEDVPRLAFEIATSQLGGKRGAPKCYACGKRTPQRLWRCGCGVMEGCDKEECVTLRRVRSICDGCARFGTCV